MARTVAIGQQDFETIRRENYFYIDKTEFIREWWESGDSVTLITRPRRFGKTLNMNMLDKFFSVRYAGRSDLFMGLSIWENEKYRALQGSYPVISLSFASVKENSFSNAKRKICQLIANLYSENRFLIDGDILDNREKEYFERVSPDMEETDATFALHQLSRFMARYYGKKVIILLDEYDTPMQEAYINGYWQELTGFTRSLFNAAFKSNEHLERAVMTGITRVSKESIFSDLNNLKVVTTTSEEYAECFGFTQQEVLEALQECGLAEHLQDVRIWYDGFTFGKKEDIYNPWSIINYLDTGVLAPYWANTSSNGLVSKLLREGSPEIKNSFERLLQGKTVVTRLEEQIVYEQLDYNGQAIWSLLLASGYLKVARLHTVPSVFGFSEYEYELQLTNLEVRLMFANMIRGWFGKASNDYNDFIKALLQSDVKAMNIYMNRVALTVFSYFDTGKNPSHEEPERFYHGFVLGLLVELAERYVITSNRESGFGRYDVMLEPRLAKDDAIVLEFKVHDEGAEQTMQDTVDQALEQIEKKKYDVMLKEKGIAEQRIRKYGFAFSGKKVLIGGKFPA